MRTRDKFRISLDAVNSALAMSLYTNAAFAATWSAMSSDPNTYANERHSFVIVDSDLPEHAIRAAAVQKADKLVADEERVRQAELRGSEPYDDRGLQMVYRFSYWVEIGP